MGGLVGVQYGLLLCWVDVSIDGWMDVDDDC